MRMMERILPVLEDEKVKDAVMINRRRLSGFLNQVK